MTKAWLMSVFLSSCSAGQWLSEGNMNPKVKAAEYAVRGPMLTKAGQLAKQLNQQDSKLPFSKITQCNIGNPQALKQKPLTFVRQVLSLCLNPDLLDHPKVGELFAPDAIERAKKYLNAHPEGFGAYSESAGIKVVRQEVADFIAKRDGYPADPDDIFLTDGASKGVEMLMKVLVSQPTDGVMAPIPQYPLYSASATLSGGALCGYYLDESKAWTCGGVELLRTLKEAKGRGINVRALVVINPGNPTGQCLSVENMKEILDFCKKEKLVLLADEVYQENVYVPGRKFVSFKKMLKDAGPAYKDVQLISFHSTSKGFYGECGLRGGYLECTNIPPPIKEQMIKLASISLCPNLVGQLAMGLMVNFPQGGQPSEKQYQKERDGILDSMKRRALKLTDALNKLEGVSCNQPEGAMYAFPTITLPQKAVAEAKKRGQTPDTLYCMSLLEATGVVVVPGSGFGQKSGTWHFRTTFLPPEGEFDTITEGITKFHQEFMEKYK